MGLNASLGDATINNLASSPEDAIALDTNPASIFTFNSLNVSEDNGRGLFANDSGVIHIISAGSIIEATGGAAVDLTGVTGQTNGVPGWTFGFLRSANSSDAGVHLQSLSDDVSVTTGTVIETTSAHGLEILDCAGNITLNNAQMSGASGDMIHVDGGSADVLVNMRFAGVNASGHLVAVTNTTGGSLTVQGADLFDDGGEGILISGNSNHFVSLFASLQATLINTTGPAVTVTNNVDSVALVGGLVIDNTASGQGGLLVENSTGSGGVTFSSPQIATDGGTGLFANNVNSLVVTALAPATIESANAPALDVSASAVDMTFDSLTSTNSGSEGIRLEGVTGSLVVNGETLINPPANEGILVRNSPGATFDFGAANIQGGTDGVDVSTNNTGAFFNFDSLRIQALNGAGLLANNSGAININDTGTTISAIGGPAVSIANTTGQTNGASGWTFAGLFSQSSVGRGVFLDTLHDDVTVTDGMIISESAGDGVRIETSPGITFHFQSPQILNCGLNGVQIANVGAATTVTLVDVLLDGNRRGIEAIQTAGFLTVDGGIIRNHTMDGAVFIQNNVATAQNGRTLNLGMSNVTFSSNAQTGVSFGISGGAILNATFENQCSFEDGDLFLDIASAQNGSAVNLVIDDCDFLSQSENAILATAFSNTTLNVRIQNGCSFTDVGNAGGVLLPAGTVRPAIFCQYSSGAGGEFRLQESAFNNIGEEALRLALATTGNVIYDISGNTIIDAGNNAGLNGAGNAPANKMGLQMLAQASGFFCGRC